jgi:hypothetical protein
MTENAENPGQAAKTEAAKLTKAERSKIAKEAATRRWAKDKRTKATSKKQVQKGKKKPAAGAREFVSALKMAEKRLGKAIQERAEAGAKYAILSAEIPSLQRIIGALRNPMGAQYEAGIIAAPSLEQIVGDTPLTYQNPAIPKPRREPAPTPPLNLPPAAHPVTSQGRAMGGAVGVELQEEENNENAFLETSGVAGGNWH